MVYWNYFATHESNEMQDFFLLLMKSYDKLDQICYSLKISWYKRTFLLPMKSKTISKLFLVPMKRNEIPEQFCYSKSVMVY